MSVVRNIWWKFDIIQIFPSLALKAERERKRYCSCVFSGLCSCRTVFEFAQSLSSQNIGLTTLGIAVRCQKDDNSQQCHQGKKIFCKEPFYTHFLQYCQVVWQGFSSLSDDLLIFITAVNQCLIFLIPISFCTHPCLNALNKSTVFKRPKRHSSLTTVWKDWRKNWIHLHCQRMNKKRQWGGSRSGRSGDPATPVGVPRLLLPCRKPPCCSLFPFLPFIPSKLCEFTASLEIWFIIKSD